MAEKTESSARVEIGLRAAIIAKAAALRMKMPVAVPQQESEER